MARTTTEIKEITKAEYRDHPFGGGESLYIEFDGRSTYIWYEQKLLRFGFVFLGSKFDDFEVIIPADPADGRPTPQKAQCFTNDLRVLQLTQQFIQKSENGTLKPGPVPIPK